MSALLDLLNLLTDSPGSMVYYLVLLFSIWALVGLALYRWSRGERRELFPRILVAGALISFMRFIPIVVALLDRQRGAILLSLGPPLERFVDAISIALVCWAFVLPHRSRALSRIFIGATSLFTIAWYVISATQWANMLQSDPSAAFNLSWQRWVWEIGQFAILAPFLAYLFVAPTQEKGMLILSLGVLAMGHLLQAVYPLADQIPHLPAWTRFASLLAYPLLAIATYRISMQRIEIEADSLQAISQESLSQITGLMSMLDTTRQMSSSLEMGIVLESAAHGMSHVLQSSLCAILLPTRESDRADPKNDLELVIVYNAPNAERLNQPLASEDYPIFQTATNRGKPIVLDTEGAIWSDQHDSPSSRHSSPASRSQVADIYRLLGSKQTGPLLIQPLSNETDSRGIVIICRPGQSEVFGSVQVRKSETLSVQVVTALENAQRYQQAKRHAEQLHSSLRLLQTEHARTKTGMENRLKQSKEETTLYIQKLYETEVGETRAQKDANQMRRQLAKLKEESEAEIRHARAELQHSIEQITHLTKQLAQIDSARIELEERVQSLEQEKGELQFQLAVAATAQSDFVLSEDEQQGASSRNHGSRTWAVEDVIDQMACGVLLCDKDAQISHANSLAATMLGRRPEELLAKSVFGLWSDNAVQSALHIATDQYQPGQTWGTGGHTDREQDIEPLLVEGAGQFVQIEISPLHRNDRHVGAIISIHNVQKADERIRARDEFLSSLAQELRTPMTSILGYTELLMNESVGKLGGIQRKFLQRVQANVERMRGMLNDLIGVTVIDSGKLLIDLEPVDMINVIETALRKVQFRLEERELTAELDTGELPIIMADPECVQQIVDNLLTNACKSSEPSTSIGIQAHIETDDLGETFLHVSVSDTGGGISPEDRSRVFERFYRADNALIAGLGETGVGLAIVKSLVEAHHGQVWHESDKVGTTFHFTLPFEPDAEAGADQLVSVSEPPTSGTGERD